MLIEKTYDKGLVEKLSKDMQISGFLSRLLVLRGVTDKESAKSFLYGAKKDLTEPKKFPNMEKAAERLRLAVSKKEKILIYGDYDCDGICAAAILSLALRDRGAQSVCYLPDRFNDGYGLNADAVKKIYDTDITALLITVDCGVTAVKEVEQIRALGMDVIVTDHHALSGETPNCIVVNPKLDEKLTPLCGAGVAFYLVWEAFGEEIAFKYIDLCAVATIGDVVPLIGDNRILVKEGLVAIRNGDAQKGLLALLNAAGVKYQRTNAEDIGFRLVPRLNSSGRLNSAMKSLKLLLEADETMHKLLCEELNMQNVERQRINNAVFRETLEMLSDYDFENNKIIVLRGNWHEGVIGITCANLVEYFNLPAILLTPNEKKTALKGSARSIDGVDIHTLLCHCGDILIKFGGHASAAGLSLDEKDLPTFIEKANAYLKKNIPQSVFERKTVFDMQKGIADFSEADLKELFTLEPHGCKNPRPVFLDTDCKANFRQISDKKHIRGRVKQGDIVAFDKLHMLPALSQCAEKSLLYSVEKNYYNDIISNSFKVSEIFAEIKNIRYPLTVEALREDFVFLRDYLKGKKRAFASVERLYLESGYPLDFIRFSLSFAILSEVKLLNISNNVILIDNAKVDLTKSNTFAYING